MSWRVLSIPIIEEVEDLPQESPPEEKKKSDYSDYWQKHEQEYTTPQWLFDELNEEFKFEWDAAATPENTKCSKFWTSEDDALVQDWNNKRIWCNPPWKHLGKWVEKAARSENSLVVMLIPASVGTHYFHEFIWDKSTHQPRSGRQVRFIEGRLKFGTFKQVYTKDTMLIVFNSLL